MTNLTDLEYLKLNKFRKFVHNFLSFFANLPKRIVGFFKKVGQLFVKLFNLFIGALKFIGQTFVKGDWKTKISYFVMGFGNAARGQWLRGIMFFAIEVAFIVYMILVGGPNIAKLGTLGTIATYTKTQVIGGITVETTVYGDNSFKILLYGVLSFFFMFAFVFSWYLNIKQNAIAEEILAKGKPLKSGKQDVQSLVDDQFHKTLLALPTLGILVFTVMPTFFMILIFT